MAATGWPLLCLAPDAIEAGLTVSVIGELQKDTYRGNGAVQFVIKDMMLL